LNTLKYIIYVHLAIHVDVYGSLLTPPHSLFNHTPSVKLLIDQNYRLTMVAFMKSVRSPYVYVVLLTDGPHGQYFQVQLFSVSTVNLLVISIKSARFMTSQATAEFMNWVSSFKRSS